MSLRSIWSTIQLNCSTIGDESLKKWATSKPKPLRVIKASNCPILLDLSFAQGRVDLLKIGEQEIIRRGSLLQASPELRHRLLKAYVETRETYEESPWVEGQIYRGFPSRSDEALMREFHGASWSRRMEISERLEDERYRKLARRIIFNERPEALDDGTRDAFSRAVALRWLSSDKVPWLTIERAFAEIEERRETASIDEASLLKSLEVYFEKKSEWAESVLRKTS